MVHYMPALYTYYFNIMNILYKGLWLACFVYLLHQYYEQYINMRAIQFRVLTTTEPRAKIWRQ